MTSGVQCILDRVVSVEPDSEAYRLAYEEAKRGLDDQEQAVVELRSRAGTLIGLFGHNCSRGDHDVVLR